MSQTIIKNQVPDQELMSSGHVACPGCGGSLAMRMVLKELGPKTVIALPACCWTIVAGPYPQSALGVPVYHTAFETAAATASGIRAALDMQGDTDTTVVAWAGDGGTFDIGLQALSGAAERNENILYVCYDNEAYMNTGIQRSSATPWGAWTTTTPTGTPKSHPKKDLLSIMAAHRLPYAATSTIAHPQDLLAKVKRAKETSGTRFLHILAPCPPGWKTGDDETINLARQAVDTRVFPLLEIEHGTTWRFTIEHPHEPVADYVKRQGRFRHLTDEQIAHIQVEVDERWAELERRVNTKG